MKRRRRGPTARSRLGRAYGIGGLVLLPWALGGLQGCSRPDDDADGVAFAYPLEEYDRAEGVITGQVRTRLEGQGIEALGLWLDLRPTGGGQAQLTADVDADCRRDETEGVARIVAEVCLKALPRHERVTVRVFRVRETGARDAPRLAGTWVWDAAGRIVSYTRPREPQD
ncbi:MAG: hypothetical protein ACP5KN_06950 [Armatimonadota bacterium]